MTFLKYIRFKSLGLVILVIGGVYVFSRLRDRSTWIEDVEVAESIIIPIEFMTSQRKYFGGHGLGWGGGHEKGYIKFQYNEKKYCDHNPYTPIVIKLYKGNFYIVYYDRETDFKNIRFRFFKSTKQGKFEEIDKNEFPKHLAIQNRWFDDDDEINKTRQLRIDKMRGSLTAKIWYQLEEGVQYYEMTRYLPLEFLQSYKEKYITNRAEE